MKTWLIARFPLIFFVLGVLAGIGALIRALSETGTPTYPVAAVSLAVYLLWVLLEARTTFHTARLEESQADHGTEIFYGLSRFATVLAAVYGPLPQAQWHVWTLVPLLLIVCGAGLRLWSIHTLGRFYSHRVRALDDHKIASTGPYRFLRHPAYTGMLTIHFGLLCYFFNFLSAALFVLLFVPSVILRIFVEEKAMRSVDGYSEFMTTRKRLIPFVW